MNTSQQSAVTPITGPALAQLHHITKVGRSPSASSLCSSTSNSSAFSRATDDMVDRLAAQACSCQTFATFHLWSAGNVRIDGLDLTVHSTGASELFNIINNDERFEIVNVVHLDLDDGDDWKVEVRRTNVASPASTPDLSDPE